MDEIDMEMQKIEFVPQRRPTTASPRTRGGSAWMA
jgi:hypothetical protein